MCFAYDLHSIDSSIAMMAANGIAMGPDGNLWFTENADNKIGRLSVDGELTEYPIPPADSAPLGIVAGPDGDLWFTESNASQIGQITP
jgi:virginiamycin B lyase